MTMANYEQRDQSGVLFKNDRKQSDKHPDYTGNCKINGVEMWMSAWIKKSNAGKTFMSFSFEPKERRTVAPERTEAEARRPIDTPDLDDSEVPF